MDDLGAPPVQETSIFEWSIDLICMNLPVIMYVNLYIHIKEAGESITKSVYV